MLEGLLQPMHLLLILGIALFVFGPERLPELGKSVGQSIRGFKEGMDSGHHDETQPTTREDRR
jgi:sec-independent protein translocase protein TatA